MMPRRGCLPFMALALLFALLCAPALLRRDNAQAYTKPVPKLQLEAVSQSKLNISETTNYRSDRMIDCIGWKIASAVRGTVSVALPDVMRGGYTVILPQYEYAAIPLRHCYVLAGFDFLPRKQLLVTVRDPEQYLEYFDPTTRRTDTIELVWYDTDWDELYNLPLDYGPLDYPDGFMLSPDQALLLAIRHPVDSEGQPAETGHSLDIVYTHDGEIRPLHLPEADASGSLPAGWYPVYMQWDKDGYLQVQTKQQLRVYSVQW